MAAGKLRVASADSQAGRPQRHWSSQLDRWNLSVINGGGQATTPSPRRRSISGAAHPREAMTSSVCSANSGSRRVSRFFVEKQRRHREF